MHVCRLQDGSSKFLWRLRLLRCGDYSLYRLYNRIASTVNLDIIILLPLMFPYHIITILIFSGRSLAARYHRTHDELMTTHVLTLFISFFILPGIVAFLRFLMLFLFAFYNIVEAPDIRGRLLSQKGRVFFESLVCILLDNKVISSIIGVQHHLILRR